MKPRASIERLRLRLCDGNLGGRGMTRPADSQCDQQPEETTIHLLVQYERSAAARPRNPTGRPPCTYVVSSLD
jgi:hypothetical protein